MVEIDKAAKMCWYQNNKMQSKYNKFIDVQKLNSWYLLIYDTIVSSI